VENMKNLPATNYFVRKVLREDYAICQDLRKQDKPKNIVDVVPMFGTVERKDAS
jgi:hypothetical protein